MNTVRRRAPLAAALGLTSVLAGCSCAPDLDSLFTFCGPTDTTVVALDSDDGSVRWERELDSVEVRTTVSDDVAVVVTSEEVTRYDAATGREVWTVEYAGAWIPSVVGDLVLLVGSAGDVAAFDADTGDVAWNVGPVPQRSRYPLDEDECPPIGMIGGGYEAVRAAALDAGDVIVVASPLNVSGVDRSSGDVVWTRPQEMLAEPVVVDGVVVMLETHGVAVGLDPADGTEAWRADLASGSLAGDAAFTGRLTSSYVIAADGIGVTVGFLHTPPPETVVGQRVDPDTGIEEEFTWEQQPTLFDVTSFVAALDAQTGEVRWRLDTQVVPQVAADPTARTVAVEFALVAAETGQPVGIMVSDELIGGSGFYVSTDRQELTFMEGETGEVRWITELDATPIRVSVSEGLVLVEAR